MVSAQPPRSESQTTVPNEVNTTSKPPPDTRPALVTSASWKRDTPSRPVRRARSAAWRTAAGEKSMPTTSAPRRAQDRVSMPKWHCRCSRRLPETSPSARRSTCPSVLFPRRNPSTS